MCFERHHMADATNDPEEIYRYTSPVSGMFPEVNLRRND